MSDVYSASPVLCRIEFGGRVYMHVWPILGLVGTYTYKVYIWKV